VVQENEEYVKEEPPPPRLEEGSRGGGGGEGLSIRLRLEGRAGDVVCSSSLTQLTLKL